VWRGGAGQGTTRQHFRSYTHDLTPEIPQDSFPNFRIPNSPTSVSLGLFLWMIPLFIIIARNIHKQAPFHTFLATLTRSHFSAKTPARIASHIQFLQLKAPFCIERPQTRLPCYSFYYARAIS
jgi:hypothetical protein